MSTAAGTNNIKTGLVLDLDPSNPKTTTAISRNLWSFPQDLGNAVWSKSSSIITENVVVAPDGTLTGDKLTATNAFAATGRASVGITTQVGQTYTTSGFAKYLDQQYMNIVIENPNSGSVTFDLINGTISGSFNASGTITLVSNGWYRCTMTYTMGVGSVLNPRFWIGNYDGTNRAGQSIYLWGLQLELGSIATDYYPASSNSITNSLADLGLATKNSNLTEVEVLVVGGGGAGGGGEDNPGGDAGGGGGAGGLIYQPAYRIIPGNTYTVTVGAGGIGNSEIGASGENSIFDLLIAVGGGRGGAPRNAGVLGGGSGGGSGGTCVTGDQFPGQGIPGQGFAGGISFDVGCSWRSGGGGGGAGSPGYNNVITTGGKGGLGLIYNITGSPVMYSAGGGGGGSVLTGIGGEAGGPTAGAGGNSPHQYGQNAVNNTGSGGGGAGSGTGFGGNGASGIVVVRYPAPQRATGGSVTVNNGYVIHTFTSGTSSLIIENSNSRLTNGTIYSSTSTGVLNFDGTDDYVITPFIPSNTAGSISVWFKLNLLKDYNTIFDNALGANDWEMWNYATGITRFRTHNDSADFIVDSPVLVINTYYNITVTWNSTAATMYLNGVLVSQDTTPGTKVMPSYLYIGGGNAGNTKLNGSVGRVSIYDRVLTSVETLQNFNSMRSRYGI